MTTGISTSSHLLHFKVPIVSIYFSDIFHPHSFLRRIHLETFHLFFCCFCSFSLSCAFSSTLPLPLSPFTCYSVMFTVGQWLTVAFPPLPNQWHWLWLLIELGWRSNSNVQQMARAFLHSSSRGPPLYSTLLCSG